MRCLLLLTISSLLAAQTATDSKAASAPAGNSDHGQKLFADYGCYQCHGREAQGGLGTGAPRLGPRAIAYVAFNRYVRQPAGQMPPYTVKVVSDQDMADIYAFVQSRPQPAPAKS